MNIPSKPVSTVKHKLVPYRVGREPDINPERRAKKAVMKAQNLTGKQYRRMMKKARQNGDRKKDAK